MQVLTFLQNEQDSYLEPIIPWDALGAQTPLETNFVQLVDTIASQPRWAQSLVVILPVLVPPEQE